MQQSLFSYTIVHVRSLTYKILLGIGAVSIATMQLTSIAHATSDFDNLFTPGSMLVANGGCSGDITTSYGALINSATSGPNLNFKNAWHQALLNGDGWGMSQIVIGNGLALSDQVNYDGTRYYSDGSYVQTGDKFVRLYVSDTSDYNVSFEATGGTSYSPYGHQIALIGSSVYSYTFSWSNINNTCTLKMSGGLYPSYNWNNYPVMATTNSDTTLSQRAWFKPVMLNFTNVSYPYAYDGPDINAHPDDDNDGLTTDEEYMQGTSDSAVDTDGDGIDDLKESIWNPYRASEFCKTSVTPNVCAYPDPTTQDIYVQIDWMDDGTRAFKPSDAQLGMVSDAYAAQGIKFHADTGQYGGGNLLSSYITPLRMAKVSTTDFFDVKGSNIDQDRLGIWRYMISGYEYLETLGSSGASFAGSDNAFISYGYIKDNAAGFNYSDFDTAIAGTIIHEIGHSLCLTDTIKFSHQNSECVYAGMESGGWDAASQTFINPYQDYESSMNYAYQMALTDYSDGSNGSTIDHDDWYAIKHNVGVFKLWDYDTDYNYSPGISTAKKSRLTTAITVDMAKKLKSKGQLKTGKSTWRHLKVVPKYGLTKN